MSKLPKLKIKLNFGYPNEDICDLEQARYRLNFLGEVAIMVEGQTVMSYGELVELASRDEYKDKEFLDAVIISELVSGG